MTSLKSNSWFTRAVVMVVVLLLGTGVANAGRKRLVVLDFEGDEAEKIQTSFIKFVKKTHTVVGIDKWNEAAEELGATKINEKNVKKVAKKLKIDGIITGNVEKRRDEYIIRIKLRSGSSGALVGSQVNAKSDAPKLSKTAKTDIEDELYGQIDGLEAVRGGGGEDAEEEEEKVEEEKPSKFGGKQMKGEKGEEEEEKPAKLSKKEEEKKKKEEELAKKEEDKRLKDEAAQKKKDDEKKRKDEEKAALATKKDKAEKADEEEEEESPLPTKTKKDDKKKTGKKKVASEEDGEEESVEEVAEPTGGMNRRTALSPGNRAVDAVVGVSMNMRRMTFSYDPTIGSRPAGYKGKLVPGGFFDMSVYPLALGHKRKDILKNIGATAMYDQVLLVKSQDASGKELKSAQVRYAFGALFRYPFGSGASAPVIGARLRYGSQSFKISQPAPLPSVTYTMIEPGIFFRLPLMSAKLVVDLNASFLAITNTGQIQKMEKYGGATVTGYEFNVGADYHLAEALFLRAMVNYETIKYSFKKNGMLPTPTDNMKVTGASDSYYGVVVSAGYLF